MWLWGCPLEHGNSVSDQTLNKDRFSHPQQLPIHGQQLLRTLKNNFQAQVILWGIISKWASIFKERLGRSNDRSNMVTGLHSFKGLQSIFSPLMTESLAISPLCGWLCDAGKKDSSWHFQRVHGVFGRSVVYAPIPSNQKAWECDVLKQRGSTLATVLQHLWRDRNICVALCSFPGPFVLGFLDCPPML